jgi:hypothetical protein
MKTLHVLFGSLALALVVGCSGAESSEVNTTSGDEAALTAGSSQATSLKKAIKGSIAYFAGADGKRTKKIEISDAPEALQQKLQDSLKDLETQAEDYGDVESAVYAVYSSPKKKSVIGYAVWAYGDNGDGGRGVIRGFTLDGKKVFDDEDSWAED